MSITVYRQSTMTGVTFEGYVPVPIPESGEFWTGMYDTGVETGIPFVPAPQPDAVQWLNDHMRFHAEHPTQ